MAEYNNYYPPVGFSFRLGLVGNGNDSSFQEVSGLYATMETTPITEGGQNLFVHKSPGRMKFEDLTLKRGLMLWDSDISNWCWTQFSDGLRAKIKPRDVTLSLLDFENDAIMIWNFKNAYPVKWGVSDLDASKSAFVVESLVLTYNYYTVENPFEYTSQNGLMSIL